MSDRTRIKIAAAVTALFLIGISAIGLAARSDTPNAATATSPPAAAQPRATTATPAPVASDEREDEPYETEGDEHGEDRD